MSVRDSSFATDALREAWASLEVADATLVSGCRELGVILFGQRMLGQNLPIELVIPRVQRDGQSAQFRPRVLAEAMIQQYKNGKTKQWLSTY